MRKVIRLARREYVAAVKTKGFIIGLVLVPLLMSGGFIAIKISEGRIDTTDKKLVVIDHTGVISAAIVEAAKTRNDNEIINKKTGKKIGPAYLIEIVEPAGDNPKQLRLKLSDRIRKGELHAFIEIGADVVHPGGDPEAARISYHSENAVMDDLRRWVAWPINNQLRRLRLTDAGIDETRVKDLFVWMQVDGLGLVSLDEETGEVRDAERSREGEAVGVPLVMIMLMFMMMIMGAQPLLHSVMEEKNQRIAEVLLGSIKPFQFMMGKLLGGLAVAFTAAAFYVVGGIIGLHFMDLEKYIPYHLLPWFFSYMILALLMFGSVFAALGSACSDIKDAQSLAFPAILPMMIPMFLLGPVLREPMGDFATGLSLFPPFTPMLMLLRQSTPGGVPLWQPIVGIAGVLILTVFSIWAGGRIFRVGILMQGKTPKLGDLVRWAIRG